MLVDVLPYLYASVLRWVSPIFTLLEGISTLLVVQMAGRVGKDWADEEEKDEGLEWRSLVGLVAAALVYCAGLAGVVWVGPVLYEILFDGKADLSNFLALPCLHAGCSPHHGCFPLTYRFHNAANQCSRDQPCIPLHGSRSEGLRRCALTLT